MNVQGDRELTLKAGSVPVACCTHNTGHDTEVSYDYRSNNTHQHH